MERAQNTSAQKECCTMNTKEWLNLNPNRHHVTLVAESGGLVRALFSGGEGVDQRFSGVGQDEEQALQRGLEARDAIKATLP